jgi:hypothetical protein
MTPTRRLRQSNEWVLFTQETSRNLSESTPDSSSSGI